MKKFFKALALVLALTLVIGTIPASAAIAKFTLKNKDGVKILYIGGSKGAKADDSAVCKTKSKFTVTKWINGFDAETMDLKLKTADKTIASKNNKYDRVYAKGIGKVKVDLYIYEKETGRQLGTITNFKVKVKKNVEATDKVANTVYAVKDLAAVVAAGKVTADDIEVVDVANAKVGVNTPYFVRLTRLDADGNRTDTDARNLVCVDKDGKDIADVKIEKLSNTLFQVTFAAGGDFTLTAQAYQSKTFDKVLASEDIKITVGYDIAAVKQESLNSVKATFTSAVKGLDKKNFKLQYKVGETFVDFAGVDTITYDAEDPTTAIVKFYRNFTEGTTYYLTYDSQDVLEFTAVKVDADSVESIVVVSKKVEAGAWEKIEYSLRDKDGVDITASSKLKGTYEFSFDPANAENGFNYQKKEMRIAKASETPYTLKVKYSWKGADAADKSKEGTATITCVAAAAWEAGNATGIVVEAGKGTAYNSNNGTRNNVAELKDFTMSEAVSKAAISICVPLTRTSAATGNVEKKFDTKFTSESNVLYSRYELKSSSEDIVMIGDIVGDNCNLIANHEGTATILIYGVEKAAPYNKVVVGSVDVVVKEKRKPSSFNVKAKDQKQGLNAAYGNDSVTFTLELKDQYGADFAGKVKITNDNPTAGVTPEFKTVWKNADGQYTFTAFGAKEFKLNSSDVKYVDTTAGVNSQVMNLKFEWVDSNLGSAGVKVVPLSVSNNGTTATYVLKLTGDKLSTNFKPDTVASSISIGLEGRNAEDYVTSGTSISFRSKAPETGKADKVNFPDGYYYTVAKDGVLLTGKNANFKGNTFTNLVVSGSAVSGGAILKLAAGSYVVTAYNVKQEANDSQSVTYVGQATFTVTDDQEALKGVKTNDLAVNKITSSDLYKAFEIKFNNNVVTGNVNGAWKNECKAFVAGDYNIAGDQLSAYVYRFRYDVVNTKEYVDDAKTIKNSLYGAKFEIVAEVNSSVEVTNK